MHDLHLANQIIKIAKEYQKKHNLKKIKKIVIELGDIIEHNEAIKPENLKYNINLIRPEIEVEIITIQGNTWKLKSIKGD